MSAYQAFRQDPTPANAVALAAANFTAAHGMADAQYLALLRQAERQSRVHAQLVDALRETRRALNGATGPCPELHEQHALDQSEEALAAAGEQP